MYPCVRTIGLIGFSSSIGNNCTTPNFRIFKKILGLSIKKHYINPLRCIVCHLYHENGKVAVQSFG